MAAIRGTVSIDPPPPALSGRVQIDRSPAVGAGGVAPTEAPIRTGGVAAVPQRELKLDWVLALLVWIGTWGQEYYQNETYIKTGDTRAEWLAKVRANRAVARRELEKAWSAGRHAVRPISREEAEHVELFVTILQGMCAPDRLKGICPLVDKKDVNPPLFDVLLRRHVAANYAATVLD